MNKIVIGLGSNVDPEKNIQKAKEILKKDFHVLAESTFGHTKPIGNPDQPDFINGVVFLETDLTMDQLNGTLKELENRLGRIRTADKYLPRTIDLDIIVWNDKIVDKDFYHRQYLKEAVLELMPNLRY